MLSSLRVQQDAPTQTYQGEKTIEADVMTKDSHAVEPALGRLRPAERWIQRGEQQRVGEGKTVRRQIVAAAEPRIKYYEDVS